MPTIKKQLRFAYEVSDSLVGSYDIDSVILFGSIGRGDWDEFSDVDLFLIMETEREPIDLSKEMIDSVSHITEDIHIVINTPEDYFRERDIPGTIAHSANREGQILFDKKNRCQKKPVLESYDKRKHDVIKKEYIDRAHEFLTEAEHFLRKKNLFRTRDAIRFGVVRALKGLFVLNDTDPPRELDLIKLYESAKRINPDLDHDNGFLEELNSYYPKANAGHEITRLKELLDKAGELVTDILGTF